MSKRMPSVGQRVVYKKIDGTCYWAKVIDVYDITKNNGLYFNQVQIEFFDTTIIPPKMTVSIDSLYVPPEGITYLNLSMIDCTCGLKFVRDGGEHSSWCYLKIK